MRHCGSSREPTRHRGACGLFQNTWGTSSDGCYWRHYPYTKRGPGTHPKYPTGHPSQDPTGPRSRETSNTNRPISPRPDRHLDSSATEAPAQSQRDATIQANNAAARDPARPHGETPHRTPKWGPDSSFRQQQRTGRQLHWEWLPSLNMYKIREEKNTWIQRKIIHRQYAVLMGYVSSSNC